MANWTVFFLIQVIDDNVNNIYQYMEKMIKEIIALKKNDSVNVILCINVDTDKVTNVFPRGINIVETGITTLFYEVKQDGEQSKLLFTKEDPLFDICNEQHITDYFQSNISNGNAADHYMLITWDHAHPFGMFKPAISKAIELEYALTKSLGIKNLKNAITNSFSNSRAGKLDLLLTNNCFLQYFDTGYELKNCVNYLVAFEITMFFSDTLENAKIIEYLYSYNPDQNTPLDIAKYSVTSFANKRLVNQSKTPTLYANDLTGYQIMADLIDELAKKLIDLLPTKFGLIKYIIFHDCEFLPTNIYLIDIGNLINKLYQKVPEAFPGTLYDDICNCLLSFVKESYPQNLNTGTNSIAIHAFSVYLPKVKYIENDPFFKPYIKGLYGKPSTTSFMNNYNWRDLIFELLQRY